MPDDESSIAKRILANVRPWNQYWYRRDKPVGERGAARDILEAAGFKVERLASREQQPPDCEGLLNGKWSGIEVTELTHEPTLKRSIKAVLQHLAGTEPKRAEAHFVWERDDLLTRLQLVLNRKDKAQPKAFFQQYVLVIHTNEMYLDRERVGRFLEGASFTTRLITHAIPGLSYDPNFKGHPVFPLKLSA